MAMRGYAKPVECDCTDHFTCRVCLRAAVPLGLAQGRPTQPTIATEETRCV